MTKKVHILGNGDSNSLMPQNVRDAEDGKVLICNIPPFAIPKAYACCMVDFKMMKNLTDGTVNLDSYKWVLGNRPKIWMDKKPTFYIQHSWHIREFYTDVPKYCGKPAGQAATNFNCGHMAAHYAARRHQPDEIHLYGFDSIMDHNMRSFTDTVLPSDRNNTNNYKLLDVWRPIWMNIFKEFGDTKFVLHHFHANSKVDLGKNVEIRVSNKKKK